MNRPGRSLRLVTSALQGQLPRYAEWPTVLKIANRAWLGPALYVALRRAARLDQIPPAVRDYLALLHDRNLDRNRLLRSQLLEATRALNARSIEPILLKGAVNLFTADDRELGARMTSDLDLSIAPFEMAEAKLALAALGYQSARNEREMARPRDVGVIELHDRPSARSASYLSNDLRASSRKVQRDGVVALIPCPSSRAQHLIVHDMIKEQDYWSLRVELRHLQDLAELAGSSEGIDWRQLGAALSDRPGRRALLLQAAALEDLFGTAIPPDLRPGKATRLWHAARLVGAAGGIFGSIARLLGEMSRGLHRLGDDHGWRRTLNFPRQVYRRLASPGTRSRL